MSERTSRQLTLAAILIVIGAWIACNKSQPTPAPTENRLDRVDAAHVQPINFLHKTFSLKKTASFEFQVPAHSALPRLHGTFQSFAAGAGGEKQSDESADVEMVVLNSEQYSDFSHGGANGTALYTVDPTHDHEVDYLLAPTQEDSVTYYVIFRNSPGGAPTKQVKADFSLTFGYQ